MRKRPPHIKFKDYKPNWCFLLENQFLLDNKSIEEQWLPVNGSDGVYDISSFGRLRSYPRRGVKKLFIVKPHVINEGYLSYRITLKGVRKSVTAHRLVATHFIPNPKNKTQINHKDFDISNNYVGNLEWCTQSENQKHSFREGTKSNLGERNPRCILTEAQVSKIKNGDFNKMSCREIGIMFGCSTSAIQNIRNGKNWKQIPFRQQEKPVIQYQ